MLGKLYPREFRDTIYDIDLDALKKCGVDGLVVDLDNTIIARNSIDVPDTLIRWVEGAKALGFKVCILSNNWHARVSKVASQLDLPLVARAVKPRKKAFTMAMREIGTTASTTAVIGDQMFTDIFGGNIAGSYTILVVPISNEEAPHTRVLRKLERILMDRYARRAKTQPSEI